MADAIVLLSGGLDSSTSMAIARERGFEVIALTFDYGQRHRKELESAARIARELGAKDHIVIQLPIGRHLASSLTWGGPAVPEGRSKEEISAGIPNTYVPSRNIIFLSIAASLAESRGAEAVFIAANSVDFSGYPDCTPAFMEAFQKVLDVGTKVGVEGKGVRIEAPLLRMSKADIVREAVRLNVPIALTWSCYKGGEKACGRCDSCQLRLEGFRKAGLVDPIDYEVML